VLAPLSPPTREAAVSVRAAAVGRPAVCDDCVRVEIPTNEGPRAYFVERASRCELVPGDVHEVARPRDDRLSGVGLRLAPTAHRRLVDCLARGAEETDLVLVSDGSAFLGMTFFERGLPVLRLVGGRAAEAAADRLSTHPAAGAAGAVGNAP
jgi:hypothetical protein